MTFLSCLIYPIAWPPRKKAHFVAKFYLNDCIASYVKFQCHSPSKITGNSGCIFPASLFPMTNLTLPYSFRFILYNHATGSLLLHRACLSLLCMKHFNTHIIAATAVNTSAAHHKFHLATSFTPTRYQLASPAITLSPRSNLHFFNYSSATSIILLSLYYIVNNITSFQLQYIVTSVLIC